MKAIKFTLSGKNAIFKKPEVNSYVYFTYGQIHKVALLGIFGAILGYGGYAQKKWTNVKKGEVLIAEYPEFYQRLKEIKVSVLPRNNRGYISKKIQTFNNSVGYASSEQGGNLIIKEQWLEQPIWDIYVLLDCAEAEKIADYLEEKRCVYFPYLGKNDHPADIYGVQRVELCEEKLGEKVISSLFPKKIGTIGIPDDEDSIEIFKYEEQLPVELNSYTNLYEYDHFCYTNLSVDILQGNVYKDKDRILVFY